MSRIHATMKNSAVSIMIQLISIIINFVSRTVLIKTLGEQYLGISGLFGNILNMLSLAELGIGATITYWLYQPMANNDEERLSVLMAIYAKIYNILGILVLTMGLSIAPFLAFFMKEIPDIPYLTLIYVLTVINMASSYFFAYKSTLIIVAQKNYILDITKFLFYFANSIIQIIVLLFFRNYLFYLIVGIISSLLGNVTISIIAEKMFPFLKNKIKARLTKEEKNEIKKDVSAIFSHNIGSFVLTSTDNMVISKFIGVVEVGLYSNYTMIIHAIQKLLNMIFGALTSSIGNLLNSVSKEKSYEVFKNIFFATCWLVGFCSVCMYILFNPFIALWLGEEYVFDNYVVFFIVLNFYLMFIRRPANTFKHCVGLFRNDKYKPFIEAFINLFTSIWLVNRMGIGGVFIGTAVSTVLACLYVEPHILYKYFYKKNVSEYFALLLRYSTVTLLSGLIIKILGIFINKVTYTSFLYLLLLCMIIPNFLFWLFFHNTAEMDYFKTILNNILNKFKVKICIKK